VPTKNWFGRHHTNVLLVTKIDLVTINWPVLLTFGRQLTIGWLATKTFWLPFDLT